MYLADVVEERYVSNRIPMRAGGARVVDGGRDEARLFGEAVLPGNGSWESLRLWEMSLLRRSKRRGS